MSIEAVIWSVLGVIALVGGVGLVAAILSLVKAPKA
ncbi:putative membrane protein [Agromyces terreus]|uniref:Membrane protein n=1 Tax=Agromyces terreus TaxID=424795 RepID=A0A9X2KAZ9_9MICO|nr:putative membrane protein [Agromyces terreus]